MEWEKGAGSTDLPTCLPSFTSILSPASKQLEAKCGHLTHFGQWNGEVMCVTSWYKHLKAGFDFPSWSSPAMPMSVYLVIWNCHKIKAINYA